MPAVYLAGELFNARQLLGNVALARQIESDSHFRCVLPQDLPQPNVSPKAVRDQDLRALLACDAAVFQYDGLELDSGTVVEYMVAKFADIPAVLLRTDFRHAGDQREGEPWNLMNSFYPRSTTLWINSMQLYQDALAVDPGTAAESAISNIATQVRAALEKVIAMPPALPRELGSAVYEWLARMPGGLPGGTEETARLYREKVAKGLL